MQMKEGFESPRQMENRAGVLLEFYFFFKNNPHPLFLLITPRAADENAASLKELHNILFCSGTHAANIW